MTRTNVRLEEHRVVNWRKLMKAMIITTIVISVLLAVVLSIGLAKLLILFSGDYVRVDKYNSDVAELNKKYDTMVSNYEQKIADLQQSQKDEITAYQTTIQNKDRLLSVINDKYINLDSKSTFIMKKFWYLYRDYPNTIDLKISDLAYLDDTARKQNFNPHLVAGIWGLEAECYSGAKSNRSTASGLGQFLASTGSWTYKTLLNRSGAYEHRTMTRDPKLMADMTISYMKYNIDESNGNIEKALMAYGDPELGARYYKIIDEKMRRAGIKGGIKRTNYM